METITTAQLRCLKCNQVSVKNVRRVNPINQYTVIILVCKECGRTRQHLVMRVVDTNPQCIFQCFEGSA